MPRYANVDKLMKHAISLDWSVLKWANEVDIITAINPNVVERKKGRWVWQGSISEGCWVCSECKLKFYQGYGNDNFCPNCGADMRGGDDA